MQSKNQNLEFEEYGESLYSTDYYLSCKKDYNLSENFVIFEPPVSENTSGAIEENKNNLTNKERYEENFL